jgi:hypothetical protein
VGPRLETSAACIDGLEVRFVHKLCAPGDMESVGRFGASPPPMKFPAALAFDIWAPARVTALATL